MRVVAVEGVDLEGFRSFVAATSVDLATEPGMTMVAGDNRAEPRLGANGCGKSTLFHGVEFALYGAPVRGLRIGDLVSHGAKRARAAVRLQVGGEARVVSRTGPPERLTIDGEPASQADVDRLVGLTRQRFLNSVVYGQGAPLLVDLPVAQRGELLDEVLDLQVWMRAAAAASRRAEGVQADLARVRVEVGRAEGALSALGDAAELERLSGEWEHERDLRRIGLSEEALEVEGRLGVLRDQLAELEKAAGRSPDQVMRRLERRQGALADLRSRLAVLRSEARRADEDAEFFRENEVCPSCGQGIDAGLAERHLAEHEAASRRTSAEERRLAAEVESEASAVADLRQSWQGARDRAAARERELARLCAELVAAEREVAACARRAAEVLAEQDPYAGRAAEVRARRAELEETLSRHRRRSERLSAQVAALDFWRQGFRRVRLFCIERVLRQLDVEAASTAASLGLVGWRVTHSTETETKSGTQRLGVQVVVQSPVMSGPFAAWSGGEGQRVRLATALGFGSLVQRWSGVRWLQEVYDESTNFLSEAGIDDLLDLLRDRADAQGKRVFVADHRGLQHAGFGSVMTVVKDECGSRVEQ